MKLLERHKEEIIKDYEKGLSIRKLSKYWGVTPPTMTKHLVKWGVKEPVKKD